MADDPLYALAELIRDTPGCDVFLVFKRLDGSFVYALRSADSDELLSAIEDALERITDAPVEPAHRPH